MILSSVKLSFIVVEYYSIDEILQCQDALSHNIPKEISYEVIVSSNSCYSKMKQNELTGNYSTLKWVFNNWNGGFAYAMNQGLKEAEGETLVIMNPDVKLGKGFDKMFAYLWQNDSIGVIAPQIKNAHGIVQDSFRQFITPQKFLCRHIRRLMHKESFEIPINAILVDWVIGAFMMMPRRAYEAVNGLDERYFLYCEDMDFCKRMHKQGYSVVYYPKAEIEYEGTRSARSSWKYAHIFSKSLLRYWSKFGFH